MSDEHRVAQHYRIKYLRCVPKNTVNKSSYAIYAAASCGSTCQHMQALEGDIAFRPLVVTDQTDPAALANLPPSDLVVVERAITGCTPLARFGNNVPDDEVFDIDINLGRMLMPSFYTLRRLGKNIYVYDGTTCAAAVSSVRPSFHQETEY